MKYRLLSPHFSEEDKYLEADTLVGDGTPHRWTRPPTAEMEGLDEPSRREVEKEKARAGEMIDPLSSLPLTLDPKEQVRLLLSNLSPDEVRELLTEAAPLEVKGKKV